MLNLLIKLVVSKLNGLLLLVTLTGFVCTNKAHPGEECLSNSNVLCFECDSRYDPNCADPFDFSPTATLDTSSMMSMLSLMKQARIGAAGGGGGGDRANDTGSGVVVNTGQTTTDQLNQPDLPDRPGTIGGGGGGGSNNNIINATIIKRQQKQLPKAVVCHGCCVKITSRMPDGGVYVKRTCTSNLQINYFMVGLVCMKESGDRGKMCFCETDYCNSQTSIHQYNYVLLMTCLVALISTVALTIHRTIQFRN